MNTAPIISQLDDENVDDRSLWLRKAKAPRAIRLLDKDLNKKGAGKTAPFSLSFMPRVNESIFYSLNGLAKN